MDEVNNIQYIIFDTRLQIYIYLKCNENGKKNLYYSYDSIQNNKNGEGLIRLIKIKLNTGLKIWFLPGKIIGCGSHGCIFNGWDKYGNTYAIKCFEDWNIYLPRIIRDNKYDEYSESVIKCNHEANIMCKLRTDLYMGRVGFFIAMRRMDTTFQSLLEIELNRKKICNQYNIKYLLYYFLDICEKVIYIHSNEIIHCDLKPSNILINILNLPDNQFMINNIMITDFGNSFSKGELNPIGEVCTRWYTSSNEALRSIDPSKEIDFNHDVCSLSCILAQILNFGEFPEELKSKESPGLEREKDINNYISKLNRMYDSNFNEYPLFKGYTDLLIKGLECKLNSIEFFEQFKKIYYDNF